MSTVIHSRASAGIPPATAKAMDDADVRAIRTDQAEVNAACRGHAGVTRDARCMGASMGAKRPLRDGHSGGSFREGPHARDGVPKWKQLCEAVLVARFQHRRNRKSPMSIPARLVKVDSGVSHGPDRHTAS